MKQFGFKHEVESVHAGEKPLGGLSVAVIIIDTLIYTRIIDTRGEACTAEHSCAVSHVYAGPAAVTSTRHCISTAQHRLQVARAVSPGCSHTCQTLPGQVVIIAWRKLAILVMSKEEVHIYNNTGMHNC